MKIRTKLTGLFVLSLSIIMIILSSIIYVLFSEYSQADFYSRLESKARYTVNLLLDVSEVDSILLNKIDRVSKQNLINERIFIYNDDYKLIYSNGKRNNYVADTLFLQEIKENIEYRGRINNAEVYALYYTGHLDKAIVVVSAEDVIGFRKLENLKKILVLTSLFGVFLSFFASFFFVKNALSPIQSIIHEVNQIGNSNLYLRLSRRYNRDEIAQLTNTFNEMLERIELSFEAQKNFISNASHELKNPLAAIIGQLNVVLLKDRDTEDYKKIITSVLEDINSVSSISNKLLLLAKASSDIGLSNFTLLRVDELLWKARNEILKRDEESKVNMVFSNYNFDAPNLSVRGNELLLLTAFVNLMDNGCKFSFAKSVNVLIDYADSQLLISFIDTGIGIDKEELKMIFEPFYRGRNSVNIKGHGLGLSLVSKIIAQHGGRITVNSEINLGSEFTVQLPVDLKIGAEN